MTKTETPRDGDGGKLCAWCGGPIRQSGVGRSKDYCSRTHKEYAYRARRDARLIANAYGQGRSEALAEARRDSTTAESPADPVTPVVETSAQVPKPLAVPEVPAPADPGGGWVRSMDVVDAQLRELEARQAAQRRRRRLAVPSPSEAPTLFEPGAADGG
jgi:hypothetical protein